MPGLPFRYGLLELAFCHFCGESAGRDSFKFVQCLFTMLLREAARLASFGRKDSPQAVCSPFVQAVKN